MEQRSAAKVATDSSPYDDKLTSIPGVTGTAGSMAVWYHRFTLSVTTWQAGVTKRWWGLTSIRGGGKLGFPSPSQNCHSIAGRPVLMFGTLLSIITSSKRSHEKRNAG
jgi:hypothetical protein